MRIKSTGKVCVNIQGPQETTACSPEARKEARGIRLTRKAVRTAFRARSVKEKPLGAWGRRVIKIGERRRRKIRTRQDDEMGARSLLKAANSRRGLGKFTASTWICTKSFWFLRPMDRLLSFRSLGE